MASVPAFRQSRRERGDPEAGDDPYEHVGVVARGLRRLPVRLGRRRATAADGPNPAGGDLTIEDVVVVVRGHGALGEPQRLLLLRLRRRGPGTPRTRRRPSRRSPPGSAGPRPGLGGGHPSAAPRITGTSPVAGSVQWGKPSGAGAAVTSVGGSAAGAARRATPRPGLPRSRRGAPDAPRSARRPRPRCPTRPGRGGVRGVGLVRGAGRVRRVVSGREAQLGGCATDPAARARRPKRGSDSGNRRPAAPESMAACASSAPMMRTPSVAGRAAGRSRVSESSS